MGTLLKIVGGLALLGATAVAGGAVGYGMAVRHAAEDPESFKKVTDSFAWEVRKSERPITTRTTYVWRERTA